MKDEKLAVKPMARYDGARYPNRDTREGEAVRTSLGKKLGSFMLAAALGLTLVGCESGPPRTVGPSSCSPKTEDGAKKAIEAGTKSPADTSQPQSKTER